jgi:hypothetical protein
LKFSFIDFFQNENYLSQLFLLVTVLLNKKKRTLNFFDEKSTTLESDFHFYFKKFLNFSLSRKREKSRSKMENDIHFHFEKF